MNNNFFTAKLTSLKKITLSIFCEFTLRDNPHFSITKGYTEKIKFNISKRVSMNNQYIIELEMEENYDFSKPYFVSLEHFPIIPVDTFNATLFPEFDEMFNYDDDDLGAIYSKKETKFSVWCPLATEVDLYLDIKNDGNFIALPMKRCDKGVYKITVKGDLKNHNYQYLVTNNSVKVNTNDPYGIGTSLDSLYSSIIDLDEIKSIGKIKPKSIIEKYTDAIIYETHIKDFTIDKNTNIEHRGKFLGFIEENRKTLNGNPAGLDYLTYIGITHVQLMPLHDYNGLGDTNNNWYNWGYDPINYFSIEGSLSTHPEIPSARLIELKTMINKLHEKDIRVNLDVVYNHIYEYKWTALEKTVPNYFFRRKNNGELYLASGCGNDIDSSRCMARKMIIDSLKYFTEIFDFDGYRFDLMGLLDVTTLNLIEDTLRPLKKDIMLYGEGWHMASNLPEKEKGSTLNADLLPTYAFFNDAYRDFLKGETFKDKITNKGFINGNNSYKFGFGFSFFGSCLEFTYNPRFSNTSQSLNYLECHDNNTLFDKLSFSNAEEDKTTLLRRINLANACITFSFGIPFFHMGQEIGLSKNKNDNTYNIPKINNMDWNLVDERIDMVNYFRDIILFRKKFTFLHETNPKVIEENFTIEFWDNNVVKISCNTDLIKPYKDFIILINVDNQTKTYSLPSYYSLIMNKDKLWSIQNGIINPCKLDILYLV